MLITTYLAYRPISTNIFITSIVYEFGYSLGVSFSFISQLSQNIDVLITQIYGDHKKYMVSMDKKKCVTRVPSQNIYKLPINNEDVFGLSLVLMPTIKQRKKNKKVFIAIG